MTGTTALGLLAACMTTGAWVPQLVRTWKRRSAKDLSWGYLGSTGFGVALWLSYGVLKEDLAIITANAIALSFILPLCGGKAYSELPS